MRKLLIVLLPIVMMSTLTACQDKEHSIIPIHIIGNEVKGIEITGPEFKTLIESGQHFVVEMYSPYCTHCEELNPMIDAYMSETKNLIYRFDVTKLSNEEQDSYIAKYPDVFPDAYVPAIRFVKDKHLTYEVSSSKFDSYKSLRLNLNQHILSSHINMTSSELTFTEYANNRSEYLVYTYDLLNEKSINIAASNIITNDFQNKNIAVLLVNSRDLAENFAKVQSYYGTELSHFVAMIKDQKVTKIADYTADDFDFTSFIN